MSLVFNEPIGYRYLETKDISITDHTIIQFNVRSTPMYFYIYNIRLIVKCDHVIVIDKIFLNIY